MDNLQNLIRNANLTNLETKVADYVMNNMMEACMITSTDLAIKINVSYSTVTRFTRALGFSGYTAFQNQLRKEYREKAQTIAEHITIPSDRLSESLSIKEDNISYNLYQTITGNMQTVLSKNQPEMFELACDLLVNSRNIYVHGRRGVAGAAELLSLAMSQMLNNVFYGPSSRSSFDYLSGISNEDCLIIFSFPRYSEMTLKAAEMAHSEKASLIVATDRATAPIAQYATALFLLDVTSPSFFNSYTSLFFWVELLLSHISRTIGDANKEKLKKIDYYISQFGDY